MVDLSMQAVQPVRLTPESRFRFRCHPGVPCFTDCCGKTTIIITPYDILRLKERLGITSGEFLEKYTRREEHDKSGLPLVVMDMPRYGGVSPFVRPVTGCRFTAIARPPAATTRWQNQSRPQPQYASGVNNVIANNDPYVKKILSVPLKGRLWRYFPEWLIKVVIYGRMYRKTHADCIPLTILQNHVFYIMRRLQKW